VSRRIKKFCLDCHGYLWHHAHGLCDSCYKRVHCPYEPTGTGPGGRGVEKSPDIIDQRLDDFFRHWRVGRTVKEASRLVGVSDRTGHRYVARLREAS
jgi:hypothetical protein